MVREKLELPLTGYSRKDPFKSADQLSKALNWDMEHDNAFTSKAAHVREYTETRLALEQLHAQMLVGARMLKEASEGAEKRETGSR